ncbi:glycosyltransferase family 4 protein [Saccharophagus degradans]|uniref:glycosyltransferase family 4 protein n=1 Tax=Saccharophagus degradans TaxID=86304 RepID=UPI00247810D0|nr:glycosyltransferase family 4 protein [Saccharophagus degradans]WGO98822.1 glycosyltransferase family 4 protein [Saccharophagus degradans]
MDKEQIALLVGNSNPRFSGVTSTMLQTLPYQQELMPLRVLGAHHLPDTSIAISFKQARKLLKQSTGPVVFHARRNDEMIQALILKHVFGANLKVVFTSTAQRYHSGLTRWLINRMDGVISTCQAAASYMVRKPDVIIPHGIHSDKYVRAPNRQVILAKWQIATPHVLGIFGRVRAQKGVHLFVRGCIEQLKNNPNFTALVVGAIKPDDKSFADNLQREIDAAGLTQRIRILGEQPFAALPELFSVMDLVCALSNNEGFGLTVLEAMSSGAAVLATEAGAWPEVVRQQVDGLVVPVENQQAVNGALAQLLADPAKLTEMGINGRARIEAHYQVQTEAKALCDFFKRVASS